MTATLATTNATAAPKLAVDPDAGDALVVAINTLREGKGLRALTTSPQLGRAARGHGASMATNGFFSHTSYDGSGLEQRIEEYYPEGNPARWSVGEVIYWQVGHSSVEQMMDAWLGSASHRADLLNVRWRDVGVGIVFVEGAPGVFGGRDVTIAVADFGVR